MVDIPSLILNIFNSDKVDGRIISYILNSRNKLEIATLAQGKSVVHISGNALKNIVITYPKTDKEQEKIADFLSTLDEKIDVEKQILDKLKLAKKGLLQQMLC